jgi:hypothetical protein
MRTINSECFKEKGVSLMAGKILLINGPTSSGKSSIANLLCESDFSFQKLNTKKIASDVLKNHEKKYFESDLKYASSLIGQPVPNVKTLTYFCENSENSEIYSLYQKVHKKIEEMSCSLFQELYTAFRDEAISLTSGGENCVIDHNIFLDPYPYRNQVFFKLFRDFGETFKSLTLYTNVEQIFQNNLRRNHKFIEFAEKFSSWKDAFEIMDAEESKAGQTFLHYRQPMQVIQNLQLHYRIRTDEDQNGELLEVIKREDFLSLISKIELAQSHLMGYLIRKGYPLVHSKGFLRFIDPRKTFLFVDQLKESECVYIYNKRFSHDFLVKNSWKNKLLSLEKKDLKGTPLEVLRPWLQGKRPLGEDVSRVAKIVSIENFLEEKRLDSIFEEIFQSLLGGQVKSVVLQGLQIAKDGFSLSRKSSGKFCIVYLHRKEASFIDREENAIFLALFTKKLFESGVEFPVPDVEELEISCSQGDDIFSSFAVLEKKHATEGLTQSNSNSLGKEVSSLSSVC